MINIDRQRLEKNMPTLKNVIMIAAFIYATVSAALQFYGYNEYYYIQPFFIVIILASAWHYRKGILLAIFLGVFHIGITYHHFGLILPVVVARVILFILVAVIISEIFREKKDLDIKLHETNNRLSNIIQFYPDATWTIDNDGKITAWNKAMEKLTGKIASDMVGKGNCEYSLLFYGSRSPMLIDIIGIMDDSLLQKKDFRLEAMTVNSSLNGKDVTLHEKAGKLYDVDGNAIGAIESITNETEYKKLEETLIESEKRFRNIVESSNDIIWEMDENAGYTYMSPNVKDILGYEPEDIVGKKPYDIMPPDQIRISKERSLNVFSDKRPVIVEDKFLHKDGRQIIFEVSAVPVLNSKGELKGFRGIARDISKRKRSEEELKELTSKVNQQASTLDAILSASPDIIMMIDRDLRCIYVNPAFMRSTRPEDKNIMGKRFPDLKVDPYFKKRLTDEINNVFSSVEPLTNEWSYDHLGSTFYYEYIISPIVDTDGKVNAVVVTARDITGRKSTEDALIQSEARFKAIFKNAGIGIKLVDMDGSIIESNPVYQRMVGYTEDELRYKKVSEITYPGDLDTNNARHRELVEGKQDSFQIVKRYVKKDGNIVWVRLTDSLVYDIGGNPLYTIGMVEDITEHKKAEEALQESESKFRILMETVSSAVIILQDDLLKFANPAAEEVTGYRREELYSMDPESLLKHIPLDKQKMLFDYKYARLTGASAPLRYEIKIFTKNMYEKWVDITCGVINFEEKPAILVTGFDVTERKRYEKKLHDSESSLRRITDNMMDMISQTDISGIFQYVSPSHKAILGYDPNDLLGRSVLDFVHPDDREKVRRDISEAIFSASRGKSSFRYRHADGHYIWDETIGNVLCNDSGDKIGAIFCGRDITERKLVEDQIKASLREKDVLLKEVHHRVKNNLQIVSSLLSLQSGYVRDERDVELFRESQNRVKSMAFIHERMYQSKDLSRIDFEEYIQSLTMHLLRSYGASGDRIVLNMDVDNVLLGVDTAIPCGLIVNELVSNSLKYAFPDGEKGSISVGLHNDNGKYILVVGDNGIGLPEDLDLRNTTTLGLQLVNTLVNQLEGEMELERDSGTLFRIMFKEIIKEKGIIDDE
ncbi:hypothetical protein CUJ83_14235 [Methanocella sp. CWC-04]|uniref:PAS domain S-box-containing protein n=1 Tax=Methanooceanicella nereidis TaxID=2052831 RepID=A0AAP2W789_9EURY|nr:PAS domain S-box protein [Methanocella sp. CWC-04]MCD1296158.1 hypothetical protein [Methanocella sp. CWC-04]